MTPAVGRTTIGVVVVCYQSAAVLESCLASLEGAAPHRGVTIRVVDNASSDSSVAIATARLGAGAVIAQGANRGFAAGVNAGLAVLETPYVAVVNPDVRVPAGALDALADRMDSRPRTGLIAPRVVGEDDRVERTAGRFPTVARERAHALGLDRFPGIEGRRVSPRTGCAGVDWVSGCAWLLRLQAVREVGPLDEAYFMYYEDVDYCHRLRGAHWDVVACSEPSVIHAIGRGSSATSTIPADGGVAPIHYFQKFTDPVATRAARRWLRLGWSLRLAWRTLRVTFGHAASRREALRYRLALERTAQA
jgi:GT2 family glycosyltransferase